MKSWRKGSSRLKYVKIELAPKKIYMELIYLPTYRKFQMGLNLENSIDFSDIKVQTCIKMSQPTIKISQKTETKWISTRKVTSKVTSVINGRTLFLNEKNNELCNLMYPKWINVNCQRLMLSCRFQRSTVIKFLCNE